MRLALPIAYALLSASLLPALVGRPWPTITIAYGFAAIALGIGYALRGGARRTGWIVLIVFAAIVVYHAQFVWRGEIEVGARLARSVCVRWRLPGCASEPAQTRDDRRAAPTDATNLLLSRYPNVYDPLAALRPARQGAVWTGYYVGLIDVVTDLAFERKRRELAEAPFYVVPGTEEDALRPRASVDWRIGFYASASLYPFALSDHANGARRATGFISMLYRRCRPVATLPGFTVCERPSDSTQ